MDHRDHVNLLQGGIAEAGGVWADLGSGRGAFTLALAELIGADSEIYSVDKDRQALKDQEHAMKAQFPGVDVHYIAADFTTPLKLPPLNGIVMANSLHFVRQKDPVLQLIRDYLQPGGRLIVVEYGTDSGNTWVPYPFSYSTWETLAQKNGFVQTRQIANRPGRFLGSMYTAVSIKR